LNEWAKRQDGVRLVERRAIKPYGFFTLVRFRRQEEAAAGRPLERTLVESTLEAPLNQNPSGGN
jgi:hypothetical protein